MCFFWDCIILQIWKNLFLKAEEVSKNLAQAFSYELASALCILTLQWLYYGI